MARHRVKRDAEVVVPIPVAAGQCAIARSTDQRLFIPTLGAILVRDRIVANASRIAENAGRSVSFTQHYPLLGPIEAWYDRGMFDLA